MAPRVSESSGTCFLFPGLTFGTVNGMVFECPNEAQPTELCGAPTWDIGGIARVSAGFQGSEKVRFNWIIPLEAKRQGMATAHSFARLTRYQDIKPRATQLADWQRRITI